MITLYKTSRWAYGIVKVEAERVTDARVYWGDSCDRPYPGSVWSAITSLDDEYWPTYEEAYNHLIRRLNRSIEAYLKEITRLQNVLSALEADREKRQRQPDAT